MESAKPNAEECWALLERVVASRHIKRSVRLRDFLEYVGTRTIKLGAESVHEQEIGVTVFGRGKNYDTGLDNIVRVNATELRKRLGQYFAEEGLQEELVLEITRGGYTPSFRRRAVPAPTVEPKPLDPEGSVSATERRATAVLAATKTSQIRWRTTAVLAGAAVAVLVALCGWLFWQNQNLHVQLQPWKAKDALQDFWTEFLGTEAETDLVLGDSSLALAQELSGKSVDLKNYLSSGYKSSAEVPELDPERKMQFDRVLDRDDGSLGDFRVARSILALDPQSKILHLKSARELTPENARQNNTVLIGNSQSNPWMQLYKDELNFQIDFDGALHHAFATNRDPRNGEKAVYDFPPDPSHVSGYCVVAFLPGLSQNRNTLILAGTDWRSTRAAGEFVTSKDGMDELRKQMPNNRFQYFEVLIESSHLVGTPMHSRIIAYRIHAHGTQMH